MAIQAVVDTLREGRPGLTLTTPLFTSATPLAFG